MKGPTAHLSWNELACWNHLSAPFRGRFQHGELIEVYPQEWRGSRAVRLAETFEQIRQYLGNVPLTVHSAYRTLEYNATVGGVRTSQHCQGRALDLAHARLDARSVFQGVRELQRGGLLPHLGGLGSYPTFVHIDVRPKVPAGHLAVWIGTAAGRS